ncbi:pyridoxamine 5'-phosphate oxidase family protein [Bellilinea sp.]|jgi:general stress protein 26|nr:pyridoxamine 5'-phosphate oxidase family protein [Bellilinea sp.]
MTSSQLPSIGRPNMPESYGLSQNAAGQLEWEWVQNQMIEARNYWVCTTRKDGRPHVMPVWGVWQENCFYFGTDIHSVKAHNLGRNPNLVVHLESGDEVVIIECRAQQISDPQLLSRVLKTYSQKYAVFSDESELTEVTIFYAAKPYKVLAWREASFPTSATRWRFDE